jgi:glycosyltransferase involved in cell wall biosynthesis
MRASEAQSGLGRSTTLRGLYDGLPAIGVQPVWVQIAAPRSRALGLAGAAVKWVWAAVRGRPLPLQSLLALQGVLPRHGLPPDPSAIIYVDGVRLAHLGPQLKARYGGRLVIDFDDLLSRRVARMRRRKEAVSFGAFADRLPKAVVSLGGALAPALYGLETRLLRSAELRAASEADAIVFASPFEARLFGRLHTRLRPGTDTRKLILGPWVRNARLSPAQIRARAPPATLRFILIGSDILEQNRVAIEGLLDLAAKGLLAAPAHIYGRMTRSYAHQPGVVFEGFAETFKEVYQPGSILLIPRSVRGGIKTKILEAFERGVPTLAAASAMEGFDRDYPWRADGAALEILTSDADALRAGYQAAAARGLEICNALFSASRYWAEVDGYVNGPQRARKPDESFQ